jgi:hypothetical protein
MKIGIRNSAVGATVSVIAASCASAALAAALPGVAGEGPATPGKNPRVKPPSIVYTGDGSGLFAGTQHVPHSPNFGRLTWTTWTTSTALGSGDNWLNNCRPDCAGGTFHGFAVKLNLSRPEVVAGHHVFTRMKVTYTGTVPSHATRTQTWKLRHNVTNSGVFFFWSFP